MYVCTANCIVCNGELCILELTLKLNIMAWRN